MTGIQVSRHPERRARGVSDDALLRQSTRSFRRDAWQRFRSDRAAMLAAVIFLGLCLIALGAPLVSQVLTGYDPNKINLRDNYAPPGARHWFGTDEYGRDYFTRILYAGRVSLGIGLLVAVLSLTIGIILGLAGGYYGGWFDDASQAAVNIASTIPGLPLLIIISSLFKLDAIGIALWLAAFGWMGSSRLIRGQVLTIKQADYVLAARAIGASNRRIMVQHILPNIFSLVLILMGFDIAGAILAESSLSFLGFGVAPPTASWGNMLSNALAYAFHTPWLVFFPGLAISLTVLCVFLLSDGLRDAMDPRL